jgi:hypothetical protein
MPPPEHPLPADHARTIPCPKCHKPTHKIIVATNHIDWPSILLIGIAAIFFPSEPNKSLQCEHCGKLFTPPTPPQKKSDRLIGYILLTFSLLMILLTLWLVLKPQEP